MGSCWRASDALVKQIVDSETAPVTMMDALRTAIKSSITGAIECEKEEDEKKEKDKGKEEEKEDKEHACVEGYKKVEGDIKGNGFKEMKKPSCDECGRECKNEPKCNSYQCSPKQAEKGE